MYWTPPQIWKEATCVIIGGGPSLKDFCWEILSDVRTIGCNDAYKLGPTICDVCFFMDNDWYNYHKYREVDSEPGLACYTGLKVTDLTQLEVNKQNIKVLKRTTRRLCEAPKIGYYYSCGGTACNLAMILGVKRIVLLGFDMGFDKAGDKNWHIDKVHVSRQCKYKGHLRPDPSVYLRFIKGFEKLKEDMQKHDKFKHVEIYNAGPVFGLGDLFPSIDLGEVV